MLQRTDQQRRQAHAVDALKLPVKPARAGRALVRLFSAAVLAAGGTLMIGAPSAVASESVVPMNDLVEQGYSCKRDIGAFGWKCTKTGRPTYICNFNKVCIPDPTVVTPEL
jgi:hypothetical protein